MKTSDATLRSALYDANVMVMADLIDIDLSGAGVARANTRFSGASGNVAVGGLTYVANGPVIERGTVRTAIGTEVATCDLRLRGRFQIDGVTISARARAGDFDNVDVAFRRVFMPTWASVPTMALDVFSGRVAEVMFSSWDVELRVKSIMYKTEEERPLRVTQAMCPWVLYSTECGAVKASFTASDSAASGSTATAVKLTMGTSYATPGGTITFTSGALNGVTAVIKSYDGGTKTATLVSQLSVAPGAGDTLTVSRGCDRTRSTCGTTFSRLVSFGGFPDRPRQGA